MTLKDSLVFTTMRNEGPFILEWVAWQKMLGFDNVLILFNDCTDRSPQLLRLLQRAGVIATKRHQPGPRQHPQPSAYAAARSHPMVKRARWMFTCDVDEFLVITRGDGSLSALLDGGDPPFAAIAINWLIYGSGGHKEWEDTLVHRRFQQSAKPHAPQNNCYKSVVKHPLDFGRFRSHSPKFWEGEGTWGEGENVLVLTDYQPYAAYHPTDNSLNSTPNEGIVHDAAHLNHYCLQSREQYELKRGRPSASIGHDRYNDDFFRRFDRNEVENPSALAYAERFEAEYAKLTAIPGALRLHHLCCADFVASLCEAQGKDPAEDPRYKHHLKTARSLPKPQDAPQTA